MRIIEYDILTGLKYRELKEAVNKAIKEGWQPLGSMTVDNENDFPSVVAQTIVKYEQQVGTEAEAKIDVLHTVVRLLQNDPHPFDSVDCSTCNTVTNLVGYNFGCNLARSKPPV